jgi:hypothetical protein
VKPPARREQPERTANVLPPPEPVETDPTKKAIHEALADLAAGRTAKAKRRLRALL